jgi:hypothetical protein
MKKNKSEDKDKKENKKNLNKNSDKKPIENKDKRKEDNKIHEKEEETKNINDDEPEWYHYIIALILLSVIVVGFFYGLSYFDSTKVVKNQSYYVDNPYSINYSLLNYSFRVEYNSPFENITHPKFPIEIIPNDIWKSNKITFQFMHYNGTDNKYVMKVSVKLMQLFRHLYGIPFDVNSSFVELNSTYCVNSTPENKVILFNPYSNKTGVFYNKTDGCILIESKKPLNFVLVGDSLIYRLLNETK